MRAPYFNERVLPEKWQHPDDPTVLMAGVPEDLRLMAEFRVRAAVLPGTASAAVQETALQASQEITDYVRTYEKKKFTPNLVYSGEGLRNHYAANFMPERVLDYMRNRLDSVIPLLDELAGCPKMEDRSVGVIAQHRRIDWHRDPDRAVFVDTIIGRGTLWKRADADIYHGIEKLSWPRRALSRAFKPSGVCEVPENAALIFNLWGHGQTARDFADDTRPVHRSHTSLTAPRFAYATAHINIKFY